jgi:MFS family permease
MQVAARRIDRVPPRRAIRAGIAIGALGMALTALQAGTPDITPWRMVASSMVMGIGSGMTLMPTMATATRALPKDRAAAASTALGINSQIWASVGTALISVVLGTTAGGPAAFRLAYAVAAALLALAWLPASLLPGRRDCRSRRGNPPHRDAAAGQGTRSWMR